MLSEFLFILVNIFIDTSFYDSMNLKICKPLGVV